jgi:hypothetical protein
MKCSNFQVEAASNPMCTTNAPNYTDERGIKLRPDRVKARCDARSRLGCRGQAQASEAWKLDPRAPYVYSGDGTQ